MGQKIHPRGLRLGIIEDWDATWYGDKKNYGKNLREDLLLRQFIKKKLFRAGISRIKINRRGNLVEIDLHTARPGLIIGKGGKDVEFLRNELSHLVQKQVELNVKEEPNPEVCSILVGENIATQIEKRISFRRAMKQAVTKALRSGAKGIKVMCAGRLGGSEIARTEWYRRGRVPLQTLRSKIDYGFTEAETVYGKIGIKVWIYKGDII